MNDLVFGLSLMLVGMGGTFFTLWVLSGIIVLLKKLFPLKNVESKGRA